MTILDLILELGAAKFDLGLVAGRGDDYAAERDRAEKAMRDVLAALPADALLSEVA